MELLIKGFDVSNKEDQMIGYYEDFDYNCVFADYEIEWFRE